MTDRAEALGDAERHRPVCVTLSCCSPRTGCKECVRREDSSPLPRQQGMRPTSREEGGREAASPLNCPQYPHPEGYLCHLPAPTRELAGKARPCSHSPFSLSCLSRCLVGSEKESEWTVSAGLETGLAPVPCSQRHRHHQLKVPSSLAAIQLWGSVPTAQGSRARATPSQHQEQLCPQSLR